MESIADWLSPALVWFIIGFVLIVLEFVIPGLVTLFFGVGAWVVFLCCWIFNIPLNMQLFIFIICSVLSLIFLRKRFKKLFEKKSDRVSLAIDELEEFIGQKAIVTEKITANKNGRVEFHGSTWNASADATIMKGKTVEIIAKNNITLIVKSL